MIPIKVTQPSYSWPAVVVSLIVANTLVFLHEQSLDPYSLNHFMTVFSLRPFYFSWGNYLSWGSVLTSMFLHGGWIHILGNMLFLWVFGENVEDILGHWKFLIFYLLCGLAAAGAQVAIDPMSRIPMVGASGAIAGVMGAYLVKFPHSRVVMLFFMLFIFRFEVPAWLMLVYWFALQVYGGAGSMTGPSQGGTAFFAHVGGFVAGIILVHLMGAHERFSRRRDLYW